MADNTIRLVLADGTEAFLDSESLTISGKTVHRERNQLAGAIAAAIAAVLNTDPTGTEYALLTRVVTANAPKIVYKQTSTNLAAGASIDLDSDQIATGKTGKLMAIRLGASVPLKGELKTVQNNVSSAVKDFFFSNRMSSTIYPLPSHNFVTQVQDAGAGFDGFRMTVTNQDTIDAAFAYVTFFYDEA